MNKSYQVKYFFKYFIRYISITIIFIILLAPLYNLMYSIIKKQTIAEDAQKVYKSIDYLNKKIESTTIISSLIEKDTYFSKLANITSNLTPRECFYMLKAGESLKDIREKYDMSIQAYVVFKSNKLFISNIMTSESYEDIFKEHLIYNDISGEEIIKQAVSPNVSLNFFPAQKVKYVDGKILNGLILSSNVSTRGFKSTDCTIVYTIDVSDILNSFQLNEESDDEFLQISDKNGNVLLNYNYSGKALEFNDTKLKYFDHKLNSENYSIIQAKTDYGNLKITRGIKSTVFKHKINSVLKIIQVYSILAILSSIILSFVLTYKQFIGVSSVLNVVKPKSNLPLEKNEYNYISSAFLQISDKNEQYEKDIMLMKNSIRSSMVEKLFLNGIYSENEKLEFTEYFNIKIEYFCVANLSLVRDCEATQPVTMFKQYEKIFHYIQKKLQSQYSNLLSTNLAGTEMIFLIPMNPDSAPNTQNVFSLMESIAKEVMSIFKQPIKVGISNIGVDIDNIHTAYLQARHAMRQVNQFESPIYVISQNDTQQNSLESFNLEQQLAEHIVTGEKEAVTALFLRLSRHIKKCTFKCEQDIMQMFFAIRSPIVSAKNTLQGHAEEIELPNYSDNLSIDNLLRLLETTALNLCELGLQKKKSNNVTLKSALLKYLNEEYADVNLCAALVADCFSISEKYVFNFVKEQTGVAFSKYVEGIRMQRAKELLQKTDMSAVEIAGKVGFSSVNTFYKAFNRAFGIAPIAWRDSNKDGPC